jgi:uncharacterized protein YbjT (DUF2867 family)
MKNIALIGATGMLGLPVAKKLVDNGFNVTAIVRDVGRASRILPNEIKIVQGDVRDTSSLIKGIEGNEALYLNLSVKQHEKRSDFHTETDGLAHILAAARKCNVQRIGMISSIIMRYQGTNQFNWWVFDIKLQSVKLLKESGIPSTIFYPSSFMETLNHQFKQGRRMLLAGDSLHKMYFIAADDYASQVVNAFRLTGGENNDFTIQGPEAFTNDEAAEIFVSNYKREKLTISKTPLGLLKFLGLFNRRMHYGAHIIEALNNYPEAFESEKTWAMLGKPTTTLAEFASQL